MRNFLIALSLSPLFAATVSNAEEMGRIPSFTDAEIRAFLIRGKAVYADNCVACHGVEGNGKGPAAAALGKQAKPRDFTRETFHFGEEPKHVFKTISSGSPGTAMPPWKSLPESDRWALTYYVLSLKIKPAH